jgi:hypothetical protein
MNGIVIVVRSLKTEELERFLDRIVKKLALPSGYWQFFHLLSLTDFRNLFIEEKIAILPLSYRTDPEKGPERSEI